jgi:hypothetical protein
MNANVPQPESRESVAGVALQPHDSPKWAAVVGDILVPLPRRHFKVRDILLEAQAEPGTPLIRDYDSPNDDVLPEDAEVDLAEGNVFRTERQGTPGDDLPPNAPAKLAFIVDDSWEVTIRPDQTGQMLRDLFNIPADAELLRDYKEPHDATIEDDDMVLFVDGPVFRTRVGTIIVSGTPHEWSKPRIDYVEVVTLFDPAYPQHPDWTYSVTYKHGPSENPDGILTFGHSVKVKDRMVFHVKCTGQS